MIPGSGVFVSALFIAGCHNGPTVNGLQLVCQLVREVFTDIEILNGDSRRSSVAKNSVHWRKVNAIKGIRSQVF